LGVVLSESSGAAASGTTCPLPKTTASLGLERSGTVAKLAAFLALLVAAVLSAAFACGRAWALSSSWSHALRSRALVGLVADSVLVVVCATAVSDHSQICTKKGRLEVSGETSLKRNGLV